MKVLISCGGTGGHIYPGIAIADKIKQEQPDAEILFVGTKNGMENQLVPASGYEIKGIDAKGFDRKHIFANIKTIHETLSGSKEMLDILDQFKPDIAIGTGNYVTGPVLLQAHKHHIPCYIHESNAMPGVANKMISAFADKVFLSFDGTQKHFLHPKRAIVTGNPVRAEFTRLDRAQCRADLGLSEDDKMILIFGGSLGAQVINNETIQLIQNLEKGNYNYKVIFVTGNRYYEEIRSIVDGNRDGKLPDFVTLMAYAYNMPQLMCAADVVVSRSGAIAVSEIAVCGRASVLIPSPNVTGNHQYYNAKALADKGAAVLLEEKYLLDESVDLTEEILKILEDPEKLSAMSAAAKSMGKTDAADIIYNNLGI
ncbi:MAG: undecaprenyldiphospho-muramoylpentapeptide beta-N-acetylglucosaminyltransferase [Firmicutes bacterium]|nr:undecaprenyldiphospho-muramoylpentapeptide beta-N-acetylglucosaminyltransferase [Bacillota bacterium]